MSGFPAPGNRAAGMDSPLAAEPAGPAGSGVASTTQSHDQFAPRKLLVRRATWEADGVMSLCLVDPDGRELAPWEPGAHLDLLLTSGLVRQYSLCGDPEDRFSYTVAVLREPYGRGGSKEVHDTALVGKLLTVRGPRNHFELVSAKRYLFIAGGIGITPIRAMLGYVDRRGDEWRLVYGGRSRGSMAFLSDLTAFGEEHVQVVPQDEKGMLDLDAVLNTAEADTVVYCCGPEGLIRAVEERCSRSPSREIHVERFGATGAIKKAAASVSVVEEADQQSFVVELRRTGVTMTIPPDRTILEVVREAVPEAMSSCEEGFCGTCETKVLEGVPQHHDTILSPAEREKGKTMMICVGRSKTPRLVLDL
jgi:ferredoxin-NADP reductase